MITGHDMSSYHTLRLFTHIAHTQITAPFSLYLHVYTGLKQSEQRNIKPVEKGLQIPGAITATEFNPMMLSD